MYMNCSVNCVAVGEIMVGHFLTFMQFVWAKLMCSVKMSGQAILWLYCCDRYHAL